MTVENISWSISKRILREIEPDLLITSLMQMSHQGQHVIQIVWNENKWNEMLNLFLENKIILKCHLLLLNGTDKILGMQFCQICFCLPSEKGLF